MKNAPPPAPARIVPTQVVTVRLVSGATLTLRYTTRRPSEARRRAGMRQDVEAVVSITQEGENE